jgi:hypothetical protein
MVYPPRRASCRSCGCCRASVSDAIRLRHFSRRSNAANARDDRMARGRYFLFATTRWAGFRNSTWALTFSICAA